MIKIGTSFLYNGKNFLDTRQGEADSLEDLRAWNLNIPPGFEVCVDGVWYVYNPEFENDPETGYFRKRIDVELGGSVDILGMQNQINALMRKTFPLSISITRSSPYELELGSSTTPTLTWKIERNGSTVTLDPNRDSVTVSGGVGTVSQNLSSWTSSSPISSNKTYTVNVSYYTEQGTLAASGKASYSFALRKYYGVSSSETIGNGDTGLIVVSQDIPNFSHPFASGWTMTTTTFDCTGGKYPYYIIPSSLYDEGTFKCWVGGLRNTDLVVTTQDVINASGYTSSYAVIRLGTLQTGQLSIRFATE